ncbi:MAG: phage capsid protein, partial [Lachnospiraceae bacterium]|nr:phage capsid protein [Lachnospiraceae bacterium]
MLKPEYFDDKADRMIEIYQELEDFIFQDIAGRLLKSQSVSGTADRLIWKLEQMGESRAEIMNKLSQITGLSRRELKLLLQDAVMTSWDDDLSTFNMLGTEVTNPLENAVVMSVMDAEYRKCQKELENLTRTTMNQSQNDLARMFDEAEMRVASGVQSYSSAICEILDNYAGKGMMIDYPTGARRSLEAAVRMCVVTSMNQTCAQITNQYIVEGNIEYVLVSEHLGARIQQPGQPYLAGHENWQGKVYKIRGSEPGYPNL